MGTWHALLPPIQVCSSEHKRSSRRDTSAQCRLSLLTPLQAQAA